MILVHRTGPNGIDSHSHSSVDSRIATSLQLVVAVFQRPPTRGREPLFLKYIPLSDQLSHGWPASWSIFVARFVWFNQLNEIDQTTGCDASVRGVAEAGLDCARRTSTFLSCAFREQEDDQAALPILRRPRVARAQKIIRLHPVSDQEQR